MQISRNLISIGVLVLLGIILLSTCTGTYNGAVSRDEAVKKAWSQVENVYQRRADLIPNLVNTVKGYANFEADVLEKVVQARAAATSIKVDPSKLTPENIKAFENAQQNLSGSLGRLLAVAENYPDLKANQSFLKLQDELAGTENRITVERKNFNERVGDFNEFVRKFPNNFITGIFGGFAEKGYFQATPGSEKVPEVKF